MHKPSLMTEQHDKKKCTSIEELTNGVWRFKKHLTRYEKIERERIDKHTRLTMDWPAKLYRNDSRCGKSYPIPGYRLLAQCDPDSPTPCCNVATGKCGIGGEFCTCDTCTDHRTMIPAELGDWVPYSCDFDWITQNEACDLLERNNISLTFVGDSLMRHIHTMSLLILSDDYLEGSLPNDITAENRQLCQGEQQITNKKCSVEIASQTVGELTYGICGGKKNMRVDLVQDYHRTLIPDVSKKANEILNQKNNWLIAGVGLHYQLDFELMKREYLDKFWSILQKSQNGWPKLIWIGIHAVHGFLRMQTGASNSKIEKFNKKVNEYWSMRNVTVIETFNMSSGLRSYDGRHYGFGFNKLKINILLKYLKLVYESNDRQK